MKRIYGFFLFLIIFLYAFIVANLSVARVILFVPKRQIKPGFMTLDISEMKQSEIILLSHCITLTPGTIAVKISETWDSLTIHCLDSRNPKATEKTITKYLREPIKRFMR